jgi:hypothetical protein
MTLSKRVREALERRDKYCWHCGQEDGLVVHHRKNRQMGGSKMLDHYSNLILVCPSYNTSMESDAENRQEAIDWGHKLESWQDFSEPVYDRCDGEWYELFDDGTKKPFFTTTVKMF